MKFDERLKDLLLNEFMVYGCHKQFAYEPANVDKRPNYFAVLHIHVLRIPLRFLHPAI